MGRVKKISRLVRSMSRGNRGVATVELALVSTVMIGLMLPMVDIGMGFYVKTQVMTAAQAGADYAFAKGWGNSNNSSPQTSINAAVMNATGLNASSTPVLTSSSTPCTYVNSSSCTGATNDLWLSCKCADGTTLSDPAGGQPASPFKAIDCAAKDSSGNTPANCSGAGQNPQKPAAYVTVKAHATYTPLITYLGFGSAVTFTQTSVSRIQ